MIYAINTGYFYLDGGAMFGVVPKQLWQKYHQPDAKNRIKQALRAFLVVAGDRKIIIDSGLGNWHSEKFRKIYGLDNSDFDFDESLAQYDLTSEEVTDVILTHLHFDHAGGIVTLKAQGIEPTFPNANLWVQKKQWQWAQNPSPKDRASFDGNYMEFLRKYEKLNLLEGKADIADGVSVYPVDGHSCGMQTVLVDSGSVKHFFPSDLIPNASHAHIPFIMAYDNNPVLTADEKQRFLSKAREENWILHFYHDPDIKSGTVSFEQGKFKIKEQCR